MDEACQLDSRMCYDRRADVRNPKFPQIDYVGILLSVS